MAPVWECTLTVLATAAVAGVGWVCVVTVGGCVCRLREYLHRPRAPHVWYDDDAPW